jgi:SET domain-containing protein
MFTVDKGEWIKVPRAEVEQLPQYAREMIYNYCTYDDDFYYIENSGFKKMDLSCFINHSEQPNIVPVNNGQYFEASRDIRSGEELLIDYGTIAG